METMSSTNDTVLAILTIAGSDSSGGAGIQADLKTFTSLGCYGASAITALTAQNTVGVQDVHPVPPAFVQQQISSVLDDTSVRAIKTGMLYDAAVVEAVVRTLKEKFGETAQPPLVCDPVCVSTSGHTLLRTDAIASLVRALFPLATVITPNKAEAELLRAHQAGLPSAEIGTLEDMLDAAQGLLELGPRAVLLKGGHLAVGAAEVARTIARRPDVVVDRDGILGENMEILLALGSERRLGGAGLVVDVLCERGAPTTVFVRPRLDSTSTHGTGCTLSAALACALGRGLSVQQAVKEAATYTHQGIAAAFPVGHGHGPLNHMHPILPRALPQPTPSNPHPFVRFLIQSNAPIWKAYVEHDFVKQLGRGTLPRASFVHFLRQDYLYLKYYSRAHGLLAAKSSEYDGIGAAARTILHIVEESAMHKAYCEQWGISPAELERTPESPACTAYGAYIVDVGLRGDASRLVMALAACLLGYGEVGLWLKREAARPDSWVRLEGNPYRKWIDDYTGAAYQDAVKGGIERIEAMAAADPPSPRRLREWSEVWERCTRLEKQFWDMGLELS
ncbi:Phosphomethylpyrimidine kinase-domain-containing protein [Amylostereum chailletii]|nr:Phosphomethylpyrimidine kinase-domain-containing protein [Amylostereum chailletii]